VLILDIELEHLARARQKGFQREAALELLLKHARRQSLDEPAPKRVDQLNPVARFLSSVAAHA
jgi:hypothetical protein